MLLTISNLTRPFKLRSEDYFNLVFGFYVQVIRLIIAGSCLFMISQFEVETPASVLDKEWLTDFFKALLAFFILMNLLFLIPATITGGANGGQLLIMIIRVFGGSCVSVSQ